MEKWDEIHFSSMMYLIKDLSLDPTLNYSPEAKLIRKFLHSLCVTLLFFPQAACQDNMNIR